MKFNTKHNQNSDFQALLLVLTIYTIFVYLLTLTPFHFSKLYLHFYLSHRKGIFNTLFGTTHFFDIILNLIMLFPFGFLFGSLMRYSGKMKRRALAIVTCIGFFISFSIEFSQIFLSRSSSAYDVITNTLGAYGGAWLSYNWNRYDPKVHFNKLYLRGRIFYLRVIILYCIFATCILLIPVYLNTFTNWQSYYHLLIGNEETMNRPWKGAIYKLSIYNRRMSDDEMGLLYSRGYAKQAPVYYSDGLLVEYLFNELPAKNVGPLEDDMYLLPKLISIEPDTNQMGIHLGPNSALRSEEPATKLAHFLKETEYLTIALWIKPENLNQIGPARIVSMSANTDFRNFTLGQSGTGLSFRVRTPLTGKNGSKVSLNSPFVLTKDKPQFVVASYNRGEIKIYYNCILQSQCIYDTSPYLPLLIGLGNNRAGIIAFCLLILMPLGWLSRSLTISGIGKNFLAGLIVFIPFIFSSLIKILLFKHRIDMQLFYIYLCIDVFIVLLGILYEKVFLLFKRTKLSVEVQ